MRRTLAIPVVIAALVVAATACSDAQRPTLTDDTLVERDCSADGLAVGPLDSDGLPSPVARTRQRLVDAAVACDYRALDRMARQNGTDIRFEGEVVPVRQWAEREHDDAQILRSLAGLLTLPLARVEVEGRSAFTWPNAVEWPFADVADARDRQALLDVVGEGGIFGWPEAGGYAGWRVTIGADGTWLRYWYGPVDGEYDRQG